MPPFDFSTLAPGRGIRITSRFWKTVLRWYISPCRPWDHRGDSTATPRPPASPPRLRDDAAFHDLDAMAHLEKSGSSPLVSKILQRVARDGPEYEARKRRSEFVPPSIAIKDVHAAVPRHLFGKSIAKSLFYIGRHVALGAVFYAFATRIDALSWKIASAIGISAYARGWLSYALWVMYWFWQSVTFTGMWTLGASSLFFSWPYIFVLTACAGHEVRRTALRLASNSLDDLRSADTTHSPLNRG